MANLTLYLPDDLVARAKAAAAADGRSVSNWMTRQLERALPILLEEAVRSKLDAPEDAGFAAAARADMRRSDVKELAGAIAGTVQRGPQPSAARRPRRAK